MPNATPDNTSGIYYGIHYLYSDTRTLNSIANPLIIVFWLDGISQSCVNKVSGMVSVADSGGTMVPATSSRADTGTGQTRCYLMYPN